MNYATLEDPAPASILLKSEFNVLNAKYLIPFLLKLIALLLQIQTG